MEFCNLKVVFGDIFLSKYRLFYKATGRQPEDFRLSPCVKVVVWNFQNS